MNRPLRIIIADDEPDLRRYYRAILTRLGHEVVATADDGNELLAACEKHHPDLVVTDISMPNLDGLSAISMSHADQRFVIISGEDKTEIEEELKGKVIARLTKPIDKADIARVMEIAADTIEQS